MPLTIFIVHRDTLVREAMAVALERAGHRVVGQAAESAAALEQVLALHPAIVLVDMDWPDVSGLALVRAVRQLHPRIHVIALLERGAGQAIFAAVLAGVDGCILRSQPFKRLLAALEDLAAGRPLLHPAAPEIARQWYRPPLSAERGVSVPSLRAAPLSQREWEVAALVAAGKTNREIASELLLSPHTVRHYLENIMDKLGVSRRVQVVSVLNAQGGSSFVR